MEFTRDPLVSAKQAAAGLPSEKLVFFLSEYYRDADGPVYRCTSPSLCVLGVLNGDLTTKRDATAVEKLREAPQAKRSYRSVDEVFAEATQ